jgi:hypothetical protein
MRMVEILSVPHRRRAALVAILAIGLTLLLHNNAGV